MRKASESKNGRSFSGLKISVGLAINFLAPRRFCISWLSGCALLFH